MSAHPGITAAKTTETLFTVTMGRTAEARSWPIENRRTMTWEKVCRDLLDPRTAEAGGAKDGTCFVPGTFTGSRRLAAEVSSISLLVGDIDCGLDAGEIVSQLRMTGWAWALASTHGHMKREFTKRFAPDAWARGLEAFGSVKGMALAWAKTVFVPAVVAGGVEKAEVEVTEGGKAVTLSGVLAYPVPRWRVVVPLAAPWVPPGGPGRKAAASWSAAYIRAWAGTGLSGLIDPACADPTRLYYTGRQPVLAGTVLAGSLVVRPELYNGG
jgi:hypothetical protein